ncbi:hypothetical protein ACINKY_24785 [Paenibacillus illinoisensis]|uniref:Uncharacterized protein n=1 Tax=Paenibacillus illinoisensis TaxID=59845 RepID=A0ABW8I0F7_9BACL
MKRLIQIIAVIAVIWALCYTVIISILLGESLLVTLSSKPLPQSTVQVQGTTLSIPAEYFEYTWKHHTKYNEFSAIDVPTSPVNVPAGSTLFITFDQTPKEITFIEQGNELNRWIRLDHSHHTIAAPDTPGIYTYLYSASWFEGSVSYVIKIKVQ